MDSNDDNVYDWMMMTMAMPKILPSIIAHSQQELNVFFARLRGKTKHLHLDIVDGKFAKNYSLNFPLRLLRKFTYSAHIMAQNPEQWIKRYFNKISIFIPHAEELKDVEKYIKWMQKRKRKTALALRPETKVAAIKPILKDLNYVLVLTVHPGFYGSRYLPSQLRKIRQIKNVNSKIKVIVDGGINPKTIRSAVKAGADFFVSGSYTTKAENPRRAIKELMKSIRKEALL